MSANACIIALLGRPRLLREGAPPHVLERRDAALLAALALQGPLRREQAMSWLWPHAERPAAQNNLRQRLFRLKQLAGRELVSSGEVLVLAPGVGHDLDTYAARLAATEGPTGVDDELLPALDYSDTGALAERVEQARREWHRRRQVLLAQAAGHHQQHGRWHAALRCVQRQLHHEPGNEIAHREHLRLHYLQGDRAAALAAWARCRQDLREHAGAEPDAATRELAALIERSGALPGTLQAPAPPPAALLRPPRLVGRDEPWRRLQAALAGRRPALVSGEPGIGKTRLLDDFARAHAGVLLIGARPGDRAQPYALLQRLLRALPPVRGDVPPWVRPELAHLLPELGPPAAGQLQPLRLQRAVAAVLADAHAGGVHAVALDDVQFADDASQDVMLACLGQPGAPAPWPVVRAGELTPQLHAWRAAETDAAAIEELHLAALLPADVEAFVVSLGLAAGGHDASWAATLARRTGGNPLFMLQVLQAAHLAGRTAEAAAASIPPSVGRLIERRLGQLGEPALRLARTAALAGVDFTLELAADVLQVHVIDLADGLAELQHAQLMVHDGFAYDLVAEALLRTVPEALARLLHANIARALARQGAAPARVAEHLEAAQSWALAAAQFDAAAAQARRPADELAWADRAAACHRQAGNAAAAYAAGVRAATAAIVVEPAAQALQRVEALLHGAADPAERLEALLLQAMQQLTGGQIAGSTAAEQALALARELGDPQRELRAINLHGAALVIGGRGQEALPLFEGMLPLAGQLGDLKAEQNFFSYYGYVLSGAMRFRDALAPIARALDLARELCEWHEAMNEAGNLATMHHRLGDREAALQAAEAAIDFWRLQGEPVGVGSGAAHMRLGVFRLSAGHYAQALAALETALSLFRAGRAAEWASHTEHHLARLWLALGQTARAQQALGPLPPDASTTARNKRLIVQARIATQSGRPRLEPLRSGLVFDTDVYGSDRFDAQLMLASLLPAGESLALCDEVLAAAHNSPPAAQHALVRKADALRRLGRHAESAAAATLAMQRADTTALELTPPEFLWLAFQALDAAGDDTAAQAALGRALHWLQEAECHVPVEFVESFRHRNPEHLALLSKARARAGARDGGG